MKTLKTIFFAIVESIGNFAENEPGCLIIAAFIVLFFVLFLIIVFIK